MNKYFKHETALVSEKARIGEGTRIWAFTNIMENVTIGKNCNICDGCFVEKGVTIGNDVTLKNGVHVFEGVILEDSVFCGANVTFVNDRYPRSMNKKDWVLEKIIVKKGATLGSNSTILCGLTIGDYSIVGAGSVVTKDVPPHTVVIGNPAEPNGFVCECGRKLNIELKCLHCSREYAHVNQSIVIKA